jgi:DNA-binding PadR family transcriptional regulator
MEIDIILLGILSGGDFFGYELMKIIKSVMSDIASVTTGTLYYKLKSHEKNGHLRSVKEREGLRPQRIRYSITKRGRAHFRKLAVEIITSRKRPYWPYLSSIFFVQHLPADEVSDALRVRRAKLLRTRERLAATRSVMKKHAYPFHTLMLVEHGMRHLEVDIAWIAEFSDMLDSLPRSAALPSFTPDDWQRHLEVMTSEGLA